MAIRKKIKKAPRRISMLVVFLLICNIFQAVLLAFNFYVLTEQRDIIRYLFVQAFTKTQ